jgi:ribosome-associated heat shock protein Hsp15
LDKASLRIDKLLWHLRLTKSRRLAQMLIAGGHVRLNSQRVDKSSTGVKIGDTLTLPRGENILVIRILSLPLHRGPAAAAMSCYCEI